MKYAQLTAVTYHHADSIISYIALPTDCQFFQMYASVNTNTMINLPEAVQALALYIQERPLHSEM